MHLSHIPQCTQNRNVHNYVLNGTLWDMSQCIMGFVRLVYCEYIYFEIKYVVARQACYVYRCNAWVDEHPGLAGDLQLRLKGRRTRRADLQ